MPNHKRLLELALKGLEAERQRIVKSPIFRSRFAGAAREAAARPDHNSPILSRNRLGVQRGQEADLPPPGERNCRT